MVLAKITALLEFMADELSHRPAKVRFMAQFEALYARDWPVERLREEPIWAAYSCRGERGGGIDTCLVGLRRSLGCLVAEHCWDPVGQAIIDYSYYFERLTALLSGEE
jgi:hypothetical protein